MDLMPSRHEQNMARWTLAGSLGVLAGSLAVRAAYSLDLTWRGLFVGCAVIGAALAGLAWRLPIADSAVHHTRLAAHLAEGFRQALAALRRGSVVRWLVLLRFSDLMLDVLLGFLALYFTDVVGIDPRQAGLAVAVWTGAGLIGDLLLIPLLERIHGLTYLRVSAALELALYAALLLVPALWLKLVLLGLLGLFNAGWYAIPKAQLFSAMPGQSGASQAVNNVVDLLGPLVPLGIGLLAQQIGLGLAMWVLLLGPIAFLLGIPRRVQP
jgi:FSR family fosmidomycin resistance protein-like MFS transporter